MVPGSASLAASAAPAAAHTTQRARQEQELLGQCTGAYFNTKKTASKGGACACFLVHNLLNLLQQMRRKSASSYTTALP